MQLIAHQNMSAKIASSSSSYYLSCHGRVCKSQDVAPYSVLTTIKGEKKIDQTRSLLKFGVEYGISRITPSYRGISTPGKTQVRASASPNNPSYSWQKWLLGFLLTVILPAVGYKGGLYSNLKSKIDKAIETVEHVTEVVEEVAEEAEKMAEEVEEKLPGDSRIKETLESFENLTKEAVDQAKKAEDVVHKVKDVEQEMEEALVKGAKDQAKK